MLAPRPATLVARLLAALTALALLAGAAGQAGPGAAEDDAPAIAAGGFGRPVLVGTLEAGDGAQVAVAGGPAGPSAVWEGDEGLMMRTLGGDRAERLIATRGLRGLWAGEAGGAPLLVWLERDLRDGSMRLSWRWRGETREVLRAAQAPRVRLVSGAATPQLLTARPSADGWILSLRDWNAEAREAPPRPAELTVAGLDAARRDGAVHLSWLEGTDEVVLGRRDASWTALTARWPDGAPGPEAPRSLGPARRLGERDVTRIATDGGSTRVAWPGADGVLRVAAVGTSPTTLGEGVPLGRLGDAWYWIDGVEVRRLRDDGELRTVLRLPAAPEHAAAGRYAGVTGIAWSSGRYLGGLEVWAVSDRAAYRASWIERLALAMGWDPWRPWSAAGGHLLLSLLAALMAATALTPAWWAGAALASRLRPDGRRAVLVDGVVLGVGTVLLGAAVVAAAATGDGASAASLTGGPVWLPASAAAGAIVAWAVASRLDMEATFGRLVTAWASGATMLLLLSFATVGAWQRLFGAVA